MTEAAPSRLLTREREELDAIAESIREGRRIVAFLVCEPELRAEVVGYLSGVSGRVVPPPVDAKDPEGMLALLTEAAEAGVGDVRSVGVDPGMEETVWALNWHREKLRKGASLLVWIPDVAGLRMVRRLAPDAFSFRDILVAVKGEKAEPVVPAAVDKNIDVRLACTAYEAAASRLGKLRAASRLAGELRMRDAPGAALEVLREVLEASGDDPEMRAREARGDSSMWTATTLPLPARAAAVSAPESLDEEEEALAVAQVHWEASAAFFDDAQTVEAWRHGAVARSMLQGRSGARERDMRCGLASTYDSPMGRSQREILDALADMGPDGSDSAARNG